MSSVCFWICPNCDERWDSAKSSPPYCDYCDVPMECIVPRDPGPNSVVTGEKLQWKRT